MLSEKYQAILDNFINGNLTDFRWAIKDLDQVDLLRFIQFWNEQQMESTKTIIKILLEQLLI